MGEDVTRPPRPVQEAVKVKIAPRLLRPRRRRRWLAPAAPRIFLNEPHHRLAENSSAAAPPGTVPAAATPTQRAPAKAAARRGVSPVLRLVPPTPPRALRPFGLPCPRRGRAFGSPSNKAGP